MPRLWLINMEDYLVAAGGKLLGEMKSRGPAPNSSRSRPGARIPKVVRGFNNVFSGTLLTLTDNRIARVPSLRVNAFNFIPLTNDDVERIEVVLGPGSALYGPNSADGVMHIITRSPFASQGTSVNVGMGERSLRQTAFRHAGALGDRLGYKVSAQYYTGTEWEYTDPEEVKARKQRQRR